MVLGVGFIAGGALAGLGAFGQLGSFSAWIGLVLSLVVNVLMYWGGFAIVVHIPARTGPSGPERSSAAWGGRCCSSAASC